MKIAILCSLLLALCLPAATQVKGKAHKPESRIPESERSAEDAHSFPELFTKLERDCMLAVQNKDKAKLDSLLAQEFMERQSTDPAATVVRDRWIETTLAAYKVESFSIRDMEIRASLTTAVVSFVLSQKAKVAGADRTGDYLVVDFWEVNHNAWQIARRYVAPVSKH